MQFKIVNTIERGKSVLTTVPSDWEKEGSLFWPRLASIKVDKSCRFEQSKPEKDWKIVNCILKRKKLNTFENAELEIEKMYSNSDTETDNKKESKAFTKKTQSRSTFEKIVQECINSTDTDSFTRGESSSIPKEDEMSKTHQEVTISQEPQITQNQLKTYQEASVSQKPQVITISQEPQVTQNHLKTHQEASVSQKPQVITIPQEPEVASMAQEFRIEDIHIDDGLIIDNTLVTKIDNLISKVNTIHENQDILQANINVSLENQKVCYDGQQLMMLHLSQTITQFKEYMNKFSQCKKKTENVDFQLIQDHEQLRCLEHLLEKSEKK